MTRGARFTCWLAPRLVRLRVLRYYTVIEGIGKMRFDPPSGVVAEITEQHRETVLLGRRVRFDAEEAGGGNAARRASTPLFQRRLARRGASRSSR